MSELSPGAETVAGRDRGRGGHGFRPAGSRAGGLRERGRAWWLRLAATFEREIEAGRGFLWLPVLLGAGIVGYFALPREPWLPAMAVAAGVLIAAAWTTRRRVVLFRVTLAITFVFVGAAWMTLRTSLVVTPRLAREQTVEVSGWVAAREAAARGGARLEVAVERIAGLTPERSPARVRITVLGSAGDIAVGDGLTLLARLRPPGGPVMPMRYACPMRG